MMVYDVHMTQKRALVSGRILKRAGLVIMRGPHVTSSTTIGPNRLDGGDTVHAAMNASASNLIVHSRGLDGVADYKLNGTLR